MACAGGIVSSSSSCRSTTARSRCDRADHTIEEPSEAIGGRVFARDRGRATVAELRDRRCRYSRRDAHDPASGQPQLAMIDPFVDAIHHGRLWEAAATMLTDPDLGDADRMRAARAVGTCERDRALVRSRTSADRRPSPAVGCNVDGCPSNRTTPEPHDRIGRCGLRRRPDGQRASSNRMASSPGSVGPAGRNVRRDGSPTSSSWHRRAT